MQAGAASSIVAIHVFVSGRAAKCDRPPRVAGGRDVNNLSRTDHNAVNASVPHDTSVRYDGAQIFFCGSKSRAFAYELLAESTRE
jgi:hypothetical protein